MPLKHTFAAFATFVGIVLTNVPACAGEHAYTEGPVVNVSSIRTVDGKFEEYMKFVDTTWKQRQEAAKKTGDVLSYQVLTVEPRNPDDPDLLLVVYFKNWAALDGWLAKGDAIANLVDGSVTAANESEGDRKVFRRILGSSTMQVLNLK